MPSSNVETNKVVTRRFLGEFKNLHKFAVVHEEDRFAPYVERTSALIAHYGGEVLDVVRAVEVVEGHWPIGALTALVRFPDEASLRAFWDSPENAAMKDLRHRTAISNVALCLSLTQA